MIISHRETNLYSKAAVAFFLVIPLLLGISPSTANASCPTCNYADSLLKPCNTKLDILTWSGHMVYQPTEEQAPCACNQNFYGQIDNCLKCESSPTADYSVAPLPLYQAICLSQGQAWKDINFPNGTTTTTTVAPTATTTATTTTTTPTTPLTSNGAVSSSSSSLSNGAIAGIVVSVIALIVALSVAAYVYSRRRREHVAAADDLDEYKYNSTSRDSYMDSSLPQYTGQIQPVLPPISKISNLRVMNPDSDDEAGPARPPQQQASFEVNRTSSPGWRRGSFDDD
ncbi:hypothetical protein FBU30_002138 [Linnemannia zychae]|nr:hypothetical protein FBU30_002138 [Linnemannia zychae]